MVLSLKVTALVMAGGKSKRLRIKKEKPLLKLLRKPMIDYVIDALSKAKNVNKIIVAVSSNTLNTKRYLESKGIEVVKTPAKGFVEDAKYAIKKKNLGITIIVSADLPLITSELIDCIVEKYFESKKNALVCLTKIEDLKKVIGETKYEFFEYPRLKGFTPIGINMINGAIIEHKSIEEDIFVINDTKKLINVNTIKELDVARRLLKGKLKNNNCYIGDTRRYWRGWGS